MATIDLRLALPDNGQLVGDKPVMVRCREHNDKTASLAVFVDGLYCFGCGFAIQNNVRAALMYLLKTDDFDESKYTSEALDAYRERATAEAKRTPLPTALAQAYSHILCHGSRRPRLEWLYARGLAPATIIGSMLGHNGFAFTIPVFDAKSNLVTIRYRRDDEYSRGYGAKYWGMPGRNGQYVFPEDALANCAGLEEVVLCEGEYDALRLWQEGVAAVTITNGAGQVQRLPALLRAQFPQIERLVIATDMDEAGREAARLTEEAAHKLGFPTRVLSWKGEAKDVSEALASGSLQPGDFAFDAARRS